MSAARSVLPQYIYFVYQKHGVYYIIALRPLYRRKDLIYCYRETSGKLVDVHASEIRNCLPDIHDIQHLEGFYTHPINPDELKALNNRLNRR